MKSRKEIGQHPSRTRLFNDLEPVSARRAQLTSLDSTPMGLRERQKANKRENRAIKQAIGGAAAVGLVAFALTRGGDTAPVNVDKLPPSQVSKLKVTADGSHYPSGIAGKVMNRGADLGQVTAEIENEVGDGEIPTGAVIKLPANQVDPAAVNQYETGQAK